MDEREMGSGWACEMGSGWARKMGSGWACEIVRACPDPLSSFAFLVDGLGIVVVVAC
jgi:hypothetical protein